MGTLAELVEESNRYRDNLKVCYDMGYDSTMNGPNEGNCHFGLFATKEMSEAYNKGSKVAILEKEESI